MRSAPAATSAWNLLATSPLPDGTLSLFRMSEKRPSPAQRAAAIWRDAARVAGSDAAGRVVPWLLLVFGVLYYAAYVRSGLNLGGEGGTAAVVAMRLMEGQRPIVDTFIGYNVLWFFPVAWLFEITGPNYLALRWYFFAFCLASGLLVYFTVHRYTRHPLFSALPAVLALLIPGMLFRNYMPFLGILNAWLLTAVFVQNDLPRWRTVALGALAGLGLGITYLFRIDLGLFNSVIFCGLALLYMCGNRRAFLTRLQTSLLALVAGFAVAFAVHIPFLRDADARGYGAAFAAQYTGWLSMVRTELKTVVADTKEKAAAPQVPPSADAPRTETPVQAQANAETWEDRGALRRAALGEALTGKNWERRSLALSTHLPLLFIALVLPIGTLLLLRAIFRGDEKQKLAFLYPLTLTGCALTLFPQYYFFRPDTVHIAEMMVPMFAAVAAWVWLSGSLIRRTSHPAAKIYAVVVAAVGLAWCAIYVSHALPKASAGTIAANKKASHRFDALNGVNVNVRRREAAWLAGLRDAVLQHSSPTDYVVCLPYSPTINFMTDRRSPLHNLYIDNSTAGPKFEAYFKKLVADSQPAVIVIDQRPINQTEASRFKNWAAQPYEWLRANYVFVGRFARNEVFVRPDKVSGPVTPKAIEVIE